MCDCGKSGTPDGGDLVWLKSSDSNSSGNCVEMAPMVVAGRPLIGVRDSKDLEAGTLTFTREEIAAWISGAKRGEFDHLLEA